MSRVTLHDASFEPFISEEELNTAIAHVAGTIALKYADKDPLFVVVLNGAYHFAARLLNGLPIACGITFVKVASYHGTSSTGKVTGLIGLDQNVEGRHVVVVEDIVDTGNTLEHIMATLAPMRPASVAVATMLFKPDAYRKDIPVDHIALRIPDHFVVGSGLDHDGAGRNLPGVYRITQQ